ncbi:MAG: alanine/ornithine racemase family PLP-dependent enzyme [Chloroflexi bacterium]|nr:MAG: alanine/ornithine racemase family PLP-dependent enzyme [Chloroflexota bacterium]RLC77504.1 MAG: alanine/ornithine racemase family PLP-dependent enzyme [Chloroflexota bacterium]HEY71703.1 alanine/ornithine racemase family PLP-dependent enzyme [Thermoflexia bacterium]
MRIEVDCERIRRNAAAIVGMCAPHGIEVVGVTKACCGHPDVAHAMLAGGVSVLADSRLKNVRRLRKAGIDADVMLLRLPSLSEADEVVGLVQISLNSEVETVRALSRAAQARGLTHQVILMVEMGDRREGLMPDDVLNAARTICALPGIDLAGIGTNLVCIGGVLPTLENTQSLVALAESIEQALGMRFRVISGGNTYDLDFVLRGQMPARVNQLRVGEGILLGVNSVTKNPLPCPHQDAFNVAADVIEVKTKPSLPEGPIATDAFGRAPHWEDLGLRRRAILALGEQDMRIDGLRPKRQGATIVGASSDHLVVDVTEAHPPVRLGDEMEFAPTYAAVATAMASVGGAKVVWSISAHG